MGLRTTAAYKEWLAYILNALELVGGLHLVQVFKINLFIIFTKYLKSQSFSI